jgi:alkanesulfonate monooxygenase SsuD/methylene tetrahydromethanopterin reductase-like flavin-dependent oxidoreductase (luciferase family)
VRIGILPTPVVDRDVVIDTAVRADEMGFDAVGLWDHYHSPEPEWGYVTGWSVYGAIAARTTRVKLVPMVLNNLHYEPGVLAKESSMLALVSGGRFELGIGAGDWPESFERWGRPFPPAEERLARLEETVRILRAVWTGEAVTLEGTFQRLTDASCTPIPPVPPRVVVGVGKSRRTLESAVRYADELNIYAEPEVLEAARGEIAASGRDVAVSLFLGWEWGNWPDDPVGELRAWQDRGIERALVNVAGPDIPARMEQLAVVDRAPSESPAT